MANFEKLTNKPAGNNKMADAKRYVIGNEKQAIKDMDLDEPKSKPAKGDSPMSEGSRDRKKGPNKYTVDRKEGEGLKEHQAKVKAAREKAGYDD